jgi:hypothetical protein
MAHWFIADLTLNGITTSKAGLETGAPGEGQSGCGRVSFMDGLFHCSALIEPQPGAVIFFQTGGIVGSESA